MQFSVFVLSMLSSKTQSQILHRSKAKCFSDPQTNANCLHNCLLCSDGSYFKLAEFPPFEKLGSSVGFQFFANVPRKHYFLTLNAKFCF